MSLFQAWRPPRTAIVRTLARPSACPVTIEVIVAPGLTSAAQRLSILNRQDAAGTTTILATPTTPAALVESFTAALPEEHCVIVPVRSPKRGRLLQRHQPSSADWVRWDFPRPGYRLDHAFVPRAIEPPAVVIALAGRAPVDSPAELWLDVVHPHTAARIRTAPELDGLLAELLTGIRSAFIVVFRSGNRQLATVMAGTEHPIAAQLIWRAGQRNMATRDAPDSAAPWEDPVVQAAAQLGFGPALGAQLTVALDDARGLAPTLSATLVELLGCQVVRREHEGGDDRRS